MNYKRLARMFRIVFALLDEGLGRKYGHDDGVDDDDDTNCIRLTYAALVRGYPKHADRIRGESRALHLAGAAAGSTVNVDAVVKLGLGEDIADNRPPPGAVAYVQGWRRRGSGHNFVVLVPPTEPAWLAAWLNPAADSDVVWIIEASNVRSDWVRPSTWAAIVKEYAHVLRSAVLR